MKEHHQEGQNKTLPQDPGKIAVRVIVNRSNSFVWVRCSDFLGFVGQDLGVVGFREAEVSQKLDEDIEHGGGPEDPAPACAGGDHCADDLGRLSVLLGELVD